MTYTFLPFLHGFSLPFPCGQHGNTLLLGGLDPNVFFTFLPVTCMSDFYLLTIPECLFLFTFTIRLGLVVPQTVTLGSHSPLSRQHRPTRWSKKDMLQGHSGMVISMFVCHVQPGGGRRTLKHLHAEVDKRLLLTEGYHQDSSMVKHLSIIAWPCPTLIGRTFNTLGRCSYFEKKLKSGFFIIFTLKNFFFFP